MTALGLAVASSPASAAGGFYNPVIGTTHDLSVDVATECPGQVTVNLDVNDVPGTSEGGEYFAWVVDHGADVNVTTNGYATVNDFPLDHPDADYHGGYQLSSGGGSSTLRDMSRQFSLCSLDDGSYDISWAITHAGDPVEYSNVLTFTVSGNPPEPEATTTSLSIGSFYASLVLVADSSAVHTDLAFQRRTSTGAWKTVWADETNRSGISRYDVTKRPGRYRAVTLATETTLRSISATVVVPR